MLPTAGRFHRLEARRLPRVATQAERREATRHRLVEVASERFALDGYEATSTDSIRQEAGISRGAMYHHFPSKRDLFEAVFEQVSSETIDRAVRHSGSGESPLADLTSACLGWLYQVQDPRSAAILLDQGPHVLGWNRTRELETQTSLGLMVGALERAQAAGEIAVASIPLTAQFLNAVLAEAALATINDAPSASTTDIEHSVRQIIEGLASP